MSQPYFSLALTIEIGKVILKRFWFWFWYLFDQSKWQTDYQTYTTVNDSALVIIHTAY